MKHKGVYRVIILFLTLILVSPQTTSGFPDVAADTSRLNSMAKEVFVLLKKGIDLTKTDSILAEAFDLAYHQKLQVPFLLYWANAEVTFRKKDFANAYKIAIKAMKSSNRQIGLNAIGEFNIFYSKAAQYWGDLSAAIEVLENNIGMARENHLKQILPQTFSRLADVYLNLKKSEEAIAALEKMLRYSIEENDLKNAEVAYFRLGTQRMNDKIWEFKEVDTYFRKALKLAMQIGDSTRIASNLSRIAWNFYMAKRLDSSLYYFNTSLGYSIPGKNYASMANSYGNIGTIYRDYKKYDQAISNWTKGIEVAEKIKDWATISWIYHDMSKMAVDKGDYEKAYRFQLYYKQYSDSTVNQAYSEGLAQARVKFESDTKQKEFEVLSFKLKNQRLLLYGFAGILASIVIISLLLLRQSKLNAQRRISEMDQKILEVTQANLRQQMNPHFIFNTLNSIQYYMYKHDKLATNNYLTKFSNLMRKILENSQHTSIPIRNEIEALELYLELESIRFRDKFDYEIQVDDEIDTILYKIPTMLIQPYVENAICHGLMYRKEKGKVVISLTLCQDYISCIIEDNGVGREASREINLKKDRHNSLGTRITESRLQLVNSLYGTSLKTTYTDLRDDHGNASGTRVEIHIPILT